MGCAFRGRASLHGGPEEMSVELSVSCLFRVFLRVHAAKSNRRLQNPARTMLNVQLQVGSPFLITTIHPK